MFKRWTHGLLSLPKLVFGLLIYLIYKSTPPFSYQAMVGLFCLTKGYSNDVLSKIISCFKRPYSFSELGGILGTMEVKRRSHISSRLREDGYYIFEEKLPEGICDRLLSYATSHPCDMIPMDGEISAKHTQVIYNHEVPQAVRYEFKEQDLLNNLEIQNIFADMSFATVAQDYLGARPVIDVTSMWWNTSFSDKPDMVAAQYYHFDMDRIKWLKFFIYLTDVKPTNGPHSFVAGSHRSGAIPSSLLKKGYARLIDEEVKREFSEENFIEFSAPRGTIIAEDTRGLHKGKHVKEGDRLILQIQFSNSLFGAYYPKSSFDKVVSETLKVKVQQYPDIYSAFI